MIFFLQKIWNSIKINYENQELRAKILNSYMNKKEK